MSATAPPEPRRNPHLFGHAGVVARFRRAAAAGRLHHAWLLVGPEGVGKSTLAWHLLRLWLAGGEVRAAADPDHPVFRTTAAGAHPDLLVPAPPEGARSREIPVEAVRTLAARLHATAAGTRRAVLLDPLEHLNRNAANALLKLLEEPPAGVLFLLVAHRTGAVPPTVLSRAARVPLAPLDEEAMRACLAALAPEADAAARETAMELAEGRPGLALRLLASDLADRYRALLEALEGGGPPAPAAVEALAGRLAEAGAEEALRPAVLLLRRLVRTRAGAAPTRALFAGEREALARLAARRPLEEWVGLWEKLAGFARRAERFHLDPSATALVLLETLAGRGLAAADPIP